MDDIKQGVNVTITRLVILVCGEEFELLELGRAQLELFLHSVDQSHAAQLFFLVCFAFIQGLKHGRQSASKKAKYHDAEKHDKQVIDAFEWVSRIDVSVADGSEGLRGEIKSQNVLFLRILISKHFSVALQSCYFSDKPVCFVDLAEANINAWSEMHKQEQKSKKNACSLYTCAYLFFVSHI